MLEEQVVNPGLAEWSCLVFSNLDCETYIIYILLVKLYACTPRIVADNWKRLIGH